MVIFNKKKKMWFCSLLYNSYRCILKFTIILYKTPIQTWNSTFKIRLTASQRTYDHAIDHGHFEHSSSIFKHNISSFFRLSAKSRQLYERLVNNLIKLFGCTYIMYTYILLLCVAQYTNTFKYCTKFPSH